MKASSRNAPLRRLNTRATLLSIAVLGCYATAPAWAENLPTGMTVVSGTASNPSLNGNVLTIKNGNGAILGWNTFNIGAGYTVNFDQAASSSVLNRVAVGNPSYIYGTLSSPGKVWLINPSGIMVGPGGTINTASFVASTLDVSNANFLAGKLAFEKTPNAGEVVNQGTIATPSGGSVYLIGTKVSNEGVITTPQGETLLAAGETVNLLDTGTPGVKVEITGAAGDTTNLGAILADAGRIGMAGVIVRNSGILNASSVVNEGGRVFLRASQDTYVDGKGRIVATGTKGGRVEVLGDRVAVMDDALIDASGATDGGTVLVGGDYQGKNPDIQNATISYFGSKATIRADATAVGDGGKVIVWSDDTTRAYGNISVRGGDSGGNGGFVETSAHRHLSFDARVDRSAPNGQAGTLLLDPSDVTITNGIDSGESYYGGVFTSFTTPSTLSWSSILSNLANGDVVVTTTYGGGGGSGNITVAAAPAAFYGGGYDITITHVDGSSSWTNTYYGAGYNSSHNLTLLADNSVNINAWFGNAGTGAINVMAGWNGASTSAPALKGSYTAGQSINISGGGGIVSKGNVTLKAVDRVNVYGSSYGSGIDLDTGTLDVFANEVALFGGGVGNFGRAYIHTNGTQTFMLGTFNYGGGIYLQGGSGAYYGNAAEISAHGGGSQSFTIMNGASVELHGGSAYGSFIGYEDCSVAPGCSDSGASIRNAGSGNQTFNFTAGGSVRLYGGSVGTQNGANIENRSTGTQTITGNPDIVIQGGSSGGAAVYYGGELVALDNAASIDSKYGAQTINAGSITLNGGTASYGGAYLSAPVQNIVATGSVSLTGNSGGALPGSYDAYGDTIFYSPAVIGSDVANTLNLTIGGSLTLTGGNTNAFGGSPAAIGGYRVPTNLTINSYGGITLSSASTGGDLIGSLGGFGGTVTLRSGLGGTGSMNLGSGKVGPGLSGTLTLDAQGTGGSITQSATGVLAASQLNASASVGSINLAGLNLVNYVYATAPGGITYNSGIPVHLVSLLSSGGNISVTGKNAYGYGGEVYLGSLSSYGSTTILADGSIIDDNGVGVTNISAGGNVNLSSYGGSGALAISADVALTSASPQISALVFSGATYGGIRIANTGGYEGNYTSLQDYSSTAGYAEIDYSTNNNVTLNNNYSLGSYYGGVSFFTGGTVTLNGSGLASFTPGAVDSYYRYIDMFAAGGFTVGGSNTTSADLLLATGGSMTFNSGTSLTANNLALYAGGVITATGTSLSSNHDLGIWAAAGLTLTNSSITAGTAGYGSAWIGSAGAIFDAAGSISYTGGGSIALTGSSISADYGDLYVATGGDLRMNNGSLLSAGYEVNLELLGSTSTLYLNDTAGLSASTIRTVASYYSPSINVHFPLRAPGAIVIDGTTTAATAAGSGFYVNGAAAAEGAGLFLDYGVAPTSTTVTGVINTVTTTINNTTSSTPSTTSTTTSDIPPPTGTTSTTSLSSLGTQTVGGSSGEFGSTDTGGGTTTTSTGTTETSGSASGDGTKPDDGKNGKDTKDDKKASDASGDKKDDKSGGKKPVGRCSA